MPQLAVETFSSQIFWTLAAFVSIYLFVARVVAPNIEQIFENRISHTEDLVKSAKQLESEAKKLEHEAFVALENAEIDSIAAESKLMASFREQSIAEKTRLYEMFSQKSSEESVHLSKVVDNLFAEISHEIDDILDTAMSSIACFLPSSKNNSGDA